MSSNPPQVWLDPLLNKNIQAGGVNQNPRGSLDFETGFVVTDDPSNDRTRIDATGVAPKFFADLANEHAAGSGRDFRLLDGYSSTDDGGGGLWVWDSASTDTVDTGTIVQTTGVATGRWRRHYQGPIDVRYFGAKGDGQATFGLSMALGTNIVSNGYAAVGQGFVPGDVGKVIVLGGHGTPGPGAAGAVVRTTITGFIDSQHVTVGFTALTAVTSGTAFMLWGTDDSAAVTAAINFAAKCLKPVYFSAKRPPPGTRWSGVSIYMLQPGTIVLKSGVKYLFENSPAIFGPVSIGPGAPQAGTLIMCIGAGKIVQPPNPVPGNVLASVAIDVTMVGLRATWTDDAVTAPIGTNVGVYGTGVVNSRFKDCSVLAPLGMHAYGWYAFSDVNGGAQLGGFEYCSFEDCDAVGDQTVTDGVGIYLALNPTPANDAANNGGVIWKGKRVVGWNTGVWIEISNGGADIDLLSLENCPAWGVRFGSPVGGAVNGAKVHVGYYENTHAAAFLVRFGDASELGPPVDNCRVEVDSCNTGGNPAGATLPAIIDPGGDTSGDNVAIVGGSTHGRTRIVPYATNAFAFGSVQGVIDGPPATKALAPLPVPVITGVAATDITNLRNYIQDLVALMAFGGLTEAVGVLSIAQTLRYLTMPYFAVPKTSDATCAVFDPIVRGVLGGGAGSAPKYRNDARAQSNVIKPIIRGPTLDFQGGGYTTGAVTAFSAGSSTLLACLRYPPAGSWMMFTETTVGTTTGTGCQLYIKNDSAFGTIHAVKQDGIAATYVIPGLSGSPAFDRHFIAATFAAGGVTIYLDGVQVATNATAGAAPANVDHGWIGQYADGTHLLTTQVDLIAGCDAFLSAGTITALANLFREKFGYFH